jgi:hypothetical protein
MRRNPVDVGIDFGTTNCLVSFCDGNGEPHLLYPKDPVDPGSPLFPSCVDSDTTSHTFGWQAVLDSLQRRIPVLRHFKLRLPTLMAKGGSVPRDSAYVASQKMFQGLFREFAKQHPDREVRRLVVTVPESWLVGDDQVAVSHLDSILSSVSRGLLGQARNIERTYVSEPCAAACYFQHAHQSRSGRPFQGYVLVYDHGGGTLDLSLLCMSGEAIVRVDGTGIADTPPLSWALPVPGQIGFGGALFDRLVLEVVSGRDDRLAARARDQRYREEWLAAFERTKRHERSAIEAALRDKTGRNAQATLFRASEDATAISLADLNEAYGLAFGVTIPDAIEQFLARMQALEPQLGPAIANGHFKLLAVGGFSQAAHVKASLQQVAERISPHHAALGEDLAGDEQWFAVAKGAALVAARQTGYLPGAPLTFGVVAYRRDQQEFIELLRKGDMAPLRAVQWRTERFKAPELRSSGGHIDYYVESGGERRVFPGRQSLNALLPGLSASTEASKMSQMRWSIGCRIHQGRVQVHTKLVAGGQAPDRRYYLSDIVDLMNERVDERVVLDAA